MWDQRLSICVPDARSRCIASDANACVTAGDYYLERGGDPQRTQAQAYYRQACDRGAAAGCTALGDMERGKSAEAWYARGCDGAHLRGCTALAESLLKRDATAERERALSLLRRACDGQDQRACARLALLPNALSNAEACELARRSKLARDGLGELAWAKLGSESRCGSSDRDDVYRGFAAACTAGEAEGCFELARLQLLGVAPEPALDRVRDWLAQACKADVTAACTALADDLERGKSGPQDPSLMRAALHDACDLGDASACARLAIALDARTPAEVARVREAWSAACKADASHCLQFAEHLLDHPQSERDPAQAEQLLRAACDQERAAGCALLADLHGWRGVQGPDVLAAREFVVAQALLEKACRYDDADSCVKAGLMLLNGNPDGLEHARELLERGCKKQLQLACAYSKQGPYPFPYPSHADVPLRFAVRPRDGRPPQPATEVVRTPAPKDEPAHAAPEREASLSAESSSRAWLQTEFQLAATSSAKVGGVLWNPHASFGGGWGALALVPLYVGTVRDAGDPRTSVGLGNPFLGVSYEDAREHDRLSFELGATLPFAYVGPDSDGLGLQAAADSSSLRDAFLWTPNSAGLAVSLGYQRWQGLLLYAADISAALLAPLYSRDNAELFGALRGQLGLRASRKWLAVLGVAVRGLSDAEQARLALEPELTYAADGGGLFTVGLSFVPWSAGRDAMGGSPWLGLGLRIAP